MPASGDWRGLGQSSSAYPPGCGWRVRQSMEWGQAVCGDFETDVVDFGEQLA